MRFVVAEYGSCQTSQYYQNKTYQTSELLTWTMMLSKTDWACTASVSMHHSFMWSSAIRLTGQIGSAGCIVGSVQAVCPNYMVLPLAYMVITFTCFSEVIKPNVFVAPRDMGTIYLSSNVFDSLTVFCGWISQWIVDCDKTLSNFCRPAPEQL